MKLFHKRSVCSLAGIKESYNKDKGTRYDYAIIYGVRRSLTPFPTFAGSKIFCTGRYGLLLTNSIAYSWSRGGIRHTLFCTGGCPVHINNARRYLISDRKPD